MSEITQERNIFLYIIHYKAQPQMMHNLKLNLTYHTKNVNKITYITPRIISQEKGEITYIYNPKNQRKSMHNFL